MNVNRSGYYKWLKRKDKPNKYERDRQLLTELLKTAHDEHLSYGYHRLAAVIRSETGWMFSDNLAHKCCKYEGIKSQTRHYNYRRPLMGTEHKKYPNLVKGNWSASRPLELVTSDMTVIKHNGKAYEWTYLLDTFNNEIISSHISGIPGDRRTYFACLKDLKEKMKEQSKPVTFHTDQGSVYSSKAFNYAIEDYSIIRSMSRAGKPTDNPVIESINGWIKDELRSEAWQHKFATAEEMIEKYVEYYNNVRPAFALQYKSPVQYRTELGFG